MTSRQYPLVARPRSNASSGSLRGSSYMRRCVVVFAIAPVIAAAVMLTSRTRGAAASNEAEWRSLGHDVANTKYSRLDQINRTNVTKLQIAWRRPTVDRSYGEFKNYSK